MRLRVGVIICALLSQTLTLILAPSAAADSGAPLISELQVAGKDSATHEFVELYNPAAAAIDLKGWKLEYHSATSINSCDEGWVTKAAIKEGQIPAHGFYLFSSTPTILADMQFNSGLASAGAVRLVDADNQIIDALGWGGPSACSLGTAAPSPAAGRSLERRPGAEAETGGNAYDTLDNQADFVVRALPGPQTTAAAAEAPIADYTPAPAAVLGVAASGAELELNELLPDPAAPLTDAADEFVEIFNPNSFPVDLAGYVIKNGASLGTKHTLPSVIVPAGSYAAVKSADTKIALSNSGTSVALFDPSGRQLGATITYGKAKTGYAWARADDVWTWTTTPSPGAANLITDPAVAAASKSTTVKAAAASKAKATAKPKAATATKTKATSTSTKPASATTPLTAATTTPGAQWLLFALAGLTIAYVIYEFRYDLRNFILRRHRHPTDGRAAGEAPAGRGSDRAGERSGRRQDDLRAGAGPGPGLHGGSSQPDVHA